jgi:hypothetical protein
MARSKSKNKSWDIRIRFTATETTVKVPTQTPRQKAEATERATGLFANINGPYAAATVEASLHSCKDSRCQAVTMEAKAYTK